MQPTAIGPMLSTLVKEPFADANQFTMESILARLQEKGDLFLPVLDDKIAHKNIHSLKQFM
jgi:hypothetical protein